MANIKVTDEDLEWLRGKASAAYELLKRGVKSNLKLIPSAECLYEHDLGEYLRQLTIGATSSFRRLNKGGMRSRKIEGSILQYMLMCGDTRDVEGLLDGFEANLEDGMGGLRDLLDAEDDRSNVEGVVFRQIRTRAAQLRKEDKYGLILKAMDYVRAKYTA